MIGRGSSRFRNRHTTLAQINVTNLVDIALVLLVIFILTAPLIKEGIEVNNPRMSTADEVDSKEPILVTLTKEKALYVNEAPTTEAEVGSRVRAQVDLYQDRPVLFKADEAINYGYVMHVMDRIRAAGVDKVTLLTQQPAPGDNPGTTGSQG